MNSQKGDGLLIKQKHLGSDHLPDYITNFTAYLKEKGVYAVFHYLSLHLSEYYKSIESQIPDLPNCDNFADRLVRLPLFYELTEENVDFIIENLINLIINYFIIIINFVNICIFSII